MTCALWTPCAQVHGADDMCLRDFEGMSELSACHPALLVVYMIYIFIFNIWYYLVLHYHGHNMFCLLSDWSHNCARFLSTNSCFLGRCFTISSLKDWSLCPDLWICTLVWTEWRSDLMSCVSPCILLDPWSQCFYHLLSGLYNIHPSFEVGTCKW